MYSIGIDVGTSNSVVSVYKRGKVEVINIEGDYLVPSVVSFRSAENMLVGAKAKRMAELYPQNTVVSVKRKIGDPKFKYTIFGKKYTPVDISAFIIQKLVQGAEEYLGEKIEDAVITVPAYFTEEQKKATKQAGEKAGLRVRRLLPEPTAAAIAYGFNKGKDQTILVYDLGGGTFDVSLLKVEGDNFTVLGVNGNHDLGGNDFDAAVSNFALAQFKKDTGIDLLNEKKTEQVARAFQVLKEMCEKAKKELSETKSTVVESSNFYQGNHLYVEITRDRFEDIIRSHTLNTKELVLKTLEEVNMGVDDIDRVILVGGSTKIPYIKQVVTETIKEPFIADNVDEIVSRGAALVAASLTAPDQEVVGLPEEKEASKQLKKIKFQDVTAYSLGTEVLESGNQWKRKTYFQPIIVKNSKVPCKGFFLGTTAQPYQTKVDIKIFRGEDRDCKNNTLMGNCMLTGIPGSASYVPVGIWFDIDEDGILHIKGAALELTNPYRVDKYLKEGKTDQLTQGKDYKITKSVDTRIEIP